MHNLVLFTYVKLFYDFHKIWMKTALVLHKIWQSEGRFVSRFLVNSFVFSADRKRYQRRIETLST